MKPITARRWTDDAVTQHPTEPAPEESWWVPLARASYEEFSAEAARQVERMRRSRVALAVSGLSRW